MFDGPQTPYTFRLRRLLYGLCRGLQLPLWGEGGHVCWFRPAESPSLLMGLRHFEADQQQEWASLLRPPEVIIDGGANIGLTVQRFDALLAGAATIWAFEPVPRHLDLLRRNCRHLAARVHILAYALGADTSLVTLLDNVRHGALSHLDGLGDAAPHEARFWQHIRTLQVQQITLDAFLDMHPTVHPTFLKLDVEGAAGRVMEGATATLARCSPVVTCSYHSTQERREVVAVLAAAGYQGIRFQADGTWRWQEVQASSGTYLHPADPRVASLTWTT